MKRSLASERDPKLEKNYTFREKTKTKNILANKNNINSYIFLSFSVCLLVHTMFFCWSNDIFISYSITRPFHQYSAHSSSQLYGPDSCPFQKFVLSISSFVCYVMSIFNYLSAIASNEQPLESLTIHV